MPDRALSAHQVLVAPREPLVTGGAAEEYERRVNDLFRGGCRHLIADLRAVSAIDSAGAVLLRYRSMRAPRRSRTAPCKAARAH